jgi:hypothetical protein
MIARLTLVAAAAAVVLLLASGPGTRLGLWSFIVAFELLKWATYIGLFAGACALVQLAIPAIRRSAARPLILAVLLGAVAAAPPLYLLHMANTLPPIHDITTDTEDAPRFEVLMLARAQSPNKAGYGGEKVADEQKRGYPDIVPFVSSQPPAQAFARALDAARAEGWEIASSDPAKGRIEATATTPWFGFKDDIVIRVRPADGGSRIDVRSASRVGESDIGENAKRVRRYLARLR